MDPDEKKRKQFRKAVLKADKIKKEIKKRIYIFIISVVIILIVFVIAFINFDYIMIHGFRQRASLSLSNQCDNLIDFSDKKISIIMA